MTAALIVLFWVVLVLAIIGAVAWATRDEPAPLPRDSELTSTQPTDADSPPAVAPMPAWLQPPWINTVPTGPMALDETPLDLDGQHINGRAR